MSALDEGKESRYYQRMAAGMGDKARILDWVNPGLPVLDVGAGGGELAAAIATTRNCEVTAVDAFKDAAEHLKAVPEIKAAHWLRADELTPDIGIFETIVCSSVLHEVFSYGKGGSTVDDVMTRLTSMLDPGGRLIIRDGVMPERPQDAARLRIGDGKLIEKYLAVVATTPHTELMLYRDGDWFLGTRHAVAEAVLTICWGPETFEREASERYQLFTLDGYAKYAASFGLELLHSDAVTQPGYLEATKGYDIVDADGSDWFPETNGLWVFRSAPAWG